MISKGLDSHLKQQQHMLSVPIILRKPVIGHCGHKWRSISFVVAALSSASVVVPSSIEVVYLKICCL